MKKRVVFTVIIGVLIVGGLWSQVNALTPNNKPEKPPITAQPSNEPSAEPSQTPAETKPPESKPTSPIEKVDPPIRETSLNTLLAGHLPNLTIKKNKDGMAVVTNTSSIFVLVNKKRNLPSDYSPKDLVIPDVPFSFSGDSPKKQMRKEAAKALEALFEAAKDDGIKLKAVSGYRSYATQKAIFENNAKNKGEEVANRTSARPGQSEHQTGLAMDISSDSVGYGLEESFGDTKEGKWLAKHAADHGFIIRFLKGKESITGYSYEPWHVRFVGKELAKDITKKKVTLEQYMDSISATINKKT